MLEGRLPDASAVADGLLRESPAEESSMEGAPSGKASADEACAGDVRAADEAWGEDAGSLRVAGDAVRLLGELLDKPAARCARPSGDLLAVPGLVALWDRLADVSDTVTGLSRGTLSKDVDRRGYVNGCLKSMQANLRHLS